MHKVKIRLKQQFQLLNDGELEKRVSLLKIKTKTIKFTLVNEKREPIVYFLTEPVDLRKWH